MELLQNISLGLSFATTPANLLYCLLGVSVGMLVGVIPGIGAITAIALLLPITFHLDPLSALVMLAGIYYGTAYGGSIASILLNLPGTPSTAIACLEGNPMAKQGRGGVALLMTTVGSFVGGSIGILILMLFSPAIVSVAIQFGSVEYFSLMVMGLVAASVVSSEAPLKGIAMVVLGILLGVIGYDIYTGTPRLTLGLVELTDGVSLIALAMGLFGVSEVVASIRSQDGNVVKNDVSFRSMIPSRDDWRRSWGPMLRGTAIGSFFGALPGTGGTVASFVSYALERRINSDPSRFGKGAIEGLVGPETSNNAADQTAFIPTLALGIPATPTMALMLGVLIIHNVAPGPTMVETRPELFWGIVMSFWIGNLLLLILNLPLIGVWIRVLSIPYNLLYPSILTFVCIGAYSIGNSAFNVFVVLFFGLVGYGMRLLGFPVAPLLLGFVLGPLMEEHFRRAMLFSRGSFSIFVTHPISLGFLVVTALLLFWAVRSAMRSRRRRKGASRAL